MRSLPFVLILFLSGCASRGAVTPIPSPERPELRFIRELLELSQTFGAGNSWGRHCLPEHLRDLKHDDWPPPLNRIPRSMTAYCGVEPAWGEGSAHKPIPPPGQETFYLIDQNGLRRPYYALTTEGCLHFRVGFRWDDGEKPSERYYNLVLPWMATVKIVLAAGCE